MRPHLVEVLPPSFELGAGVTERAEQGLVQALIPQTPGACQEFRVGRRFEHQAAMALVKRSPKRMANCALAMIHSRGPIFHSFSDRFKTRKSSFSGFGIDGSIDVLQSCRDGLTVLVGDEVQAVAQQVHNACLNRGVRKALQAIDDREQE
jgi:hypothetical protein